MFLKTLKSVGQKIKSFRYGTAIVFSFLALVVTIGAVQASGPMRPPHPPTKGMWEMPSRPWWPMAPVPEIHVVAVEENVSVTIETENFPEEEDFIVTMGYIYTRGRDGIVVGSFNSGDGESQQHSFRIPQELADEYRIAIRASTDHTFPYYAFNWFYNNSSNGASTNGTAEVTTDEAVSSDTDTDGTDEAQTSAESAAEVEQTVISAEEVNDVDEDEEVPSFEICHVEKDIKVEFDTNNFPANKVFTVKMGVMPNPPKPDPYYNGKMMPMPHGEMDMGMPMPPMHPSSMGKPMQPSKIWIPYYEAGTFETGENGDVYLGFDIPAELIGAYRISIMMYSDDTYPYNAYNWFYNNDATVCEP